MDAVRRVATFDLLRLLGLRSVWVLTAVGLTIHTAISVAMVAVLLAVRAEAGLDYAPSDIAALVVGREPLLAPLAGLVAVVVVGQEYRHGSRSAVMLLAGSRGALVAGKLLVALVVSLVVGSVGVALSTGLLLTNGVAGPLDGSTLAAIALARILAVVLNAGYAACLAFALRSQTAAMAALLVIPLLLENGIATAVRQLGEGWWQALPPRLPYTSLDALVPVGVDAAAPSMFAAPGVAPGLAALCALGYLTFGVAVAARRA